MHVEQWHKRRVVMGLLNERQQWVMDMQVKDMSPAQKLDALRILDMVMQLRMYKDREKEIRASMCRPKQKRRKGEQELLFEVKVKQSNLPGSR